MGVSVSLLRGVDSKRVGGGPARETPAGHMAVSVTLIREVKGGPVGPSREGAESNLGPLLVEEMSLCDWWK